jgi:hypothetical protein
MEQQCVLPLRQKQLVLTTMVDQYSNYFDVHAFEWHKVRQGIYLVVLSFHEIEHFVDENDELAMRFSEEITKAIFLVDNRDAILLCDRPEEDIEWIKLSRSRKTISIALRQYQGWLRTSEFTLKTVSFDTRSALQL